ncbi:O-antigen ligase family protein [Microvirga sp. GCM10011540]|uniref:O-antigen ligase family protein n=1 Tax=Microvirga sp. GCM10011540 TaxID=3317338 RepID=UPI00361C37FA
MSILETASAERALPNAGSRLAGILWQVAMAALAVMPLGMTIAHRSSPAFLAVSALCALGAVAAEGRLRQVGREALAALKSPLGLAILAFLAWSAISIGWSPFKSLSLFTLGELWIPVASAFTVALVLPRRMTRAAFWLLAASTAAACLLIVVELRTGLALRQSLGMRANTFIFNRPTLTLLVLMLPLLAWLAGSGRHGWAWSAGIGLAFATALAHSDSGAALLGLLVVAPVFLIAWLFPRLTGWLAAGACVVAMATAPFLGPIADSLITPSMHERMADHHTRERVDLWRSFSAAVRQQPVLGAGFGVSPRIRETRVARKVAPQMRRMLAIGHPHSTPLQVWTELGAVGAFLALVILLLVLRAIRRQSRLVMSLSMALFAGAAAVSMVGHGAWQGWWAASLGAAIVWMLAFRKTRLETMP